MQDYEKLARQWLPRITLLGALLVITATVLHPITIDPWNADLPIQFIAAKRAYWMWDHSLMAVAILLWLGGLAGCFRLFRHSDKMVTVVVALFISSIAIWLITLAFELGGMPISVQRLQIHSDPVHRSLAESLFSSALLSGYFAMIPVWMGVALGARTKWGRFSGCIGILGIGYCLLVPTLWILLVSSAFPFIWTLIFNWECLKGEMINELEG